MPVGVQLGDRKVHSNLIGKDCNELLNVTWEWVNEGLMSDKSSSFKEVKSSFYPRPERMLLHTQENSQPVGGSFEFLLLECAL